MCKNKLILTGDGFAHCDRNGNIYYSWKINKLQVIQILPRCLNRFLRYHPEVIEKGYDLVMLEHYWYSDIIGPEYSK